VKFTEPANVLIEPGFRVKTPLEARPPCFFAISFERTMSFEAYM
jgi:hypothetical protein